MFSASSSRLLARGLATTSSSARRAVLVDGVRTPFCLAMTEHKDKIAYDLGRDVLRGLVAKTGVDGSDIDYVLMGTVIQEVRTSNLARECAIGAGIPNSVPANTVTMACISSCVAVTNAAEKILAGQANAVIAGGVETFSDVPIRFSKKLREGMLKSQKVKGVLGKIQTIFKGVGLKDLAPETPAIANFATGEVMGSSSDRLSQRFGVTREEMDLFALASHENAAAAHAAGKFDDEIIPINGKTLDNGIKTDSSIEKLASLRAAFIRPHGTHTGGNSSFLTDGAAATLIMSEEHALAEGYKPKAALKSWNYVAVDPWEELLLGPAYAISKMLLDNGLTIADIDVWEIHEAFAGQVLANLKALESDEFAQASLEGRDAAVGSIPRDKLNVNGGSLALGHPFGATGARLAMTAANRLHSEGGRFAITAACADSGLANCTLLEIC
jgi:acetyl-CoA acetyltransferase family protein